MLENKKTTKKFSLDLNGENFFYLEHFKLNVRSFDFLRLTSKE